MQMINVLAMAALASATSNSPRQEEVNTSVFFYETELCGGSYYYNDTILSPGCVDEDDTKLSVGSFNVTTGQSACVTFYDTETCDYTQGSFEQFYGTFDGGCNTYNLSFVPSCTRIQTSGESCPDVTTGCTF